MGGERSFSVESEVRDRDGGQGIVHRLEARIEELEARLSNAYILDTLVEYAQNQLVYLDRHFTFIYVSASYARAARRAPEELIGRNHFELYPHAENQAIFERVRDTGEPAVWKEKPFLFPDQPERGVTYWDWTLTPIKDATGFVTGLVFSLRDVTQEVEIRHRLEESEQRFRLMADGAPSIIWVTGKDGGLLFANRYYREYFGVTYEQAEGGRWQPLVHPEDASSYVLAFQRALDERRPFVAEARVRHANGEWRLIASRADPRFSTSGEFLGYVGISHDITDSKRAEEALRESERRLHLAQDAANAGTWEWNLQTGKVFWSEELCKLYGVDPGSARPSYEAWLRIVHPDDRAAVKRVVQEALRHGGELNNEWRVSARDGAERWLMSRGRPLRAEDGALVGYIGNVIDITARKRAEQALRDSEAKYRSLFENLLTAFAHCTMIYDEQGRPIDVGFLNVNDAFCKVTGVVDAIGKRMSDVMPGMMTMEPGWIEIAARVASSGRPERFETYAKALKKWLSISIYSPEKDHFVALFDDIGERKAAEAEREKLVEALRETDRRKNEFLAVLSHELRNPLAPIKNSLYILGHASSDRQAARRALVVINRQVDQLTRLVDDLLDLTRISCGKIHLQRQPLELNQLVRRTIEDHRLLFEQHGIHLEFSGAPQPVVVDADRHRMAQVVGNLLLNAVKFSERGGQTLVTVAPDSAARQAVVCVADTGIGMTPDMLSRLFQPFMQAENTLDRRRGGLGLGLALVKGLVELHGGNVTASSAGLGRGAVMIVRLPLESRHLAEPPICPETAPSRRRRVLIVEDNVDAADSLREVLQLREHEVAVAYSGPEGIALARALAPEVVLCDIGLPGMDGYEVARAIRADAEIAGTCLVALSGYALPDDLRRAREAGFDRHLAKPPSAEKLEELLRSLRS